MNLDNCSFFDNLEDLILCISEYFYEDYRDNEIILAWNEPVIRRYNSIALFLKYRLINDVFASISAKRQTVEDLRQALELLSYESDNKSRQLRSRIQVMIDHIESE